MQPRQMADTSSPVRPSFRYFMVSSWSGRRDGVRLVESEFPHRDLAHLDLADLPRDGHGELVHELPVPGDLVGGDASPAELGQIVAGRLSAVAQLHPDHHLLAVALAGDADHLG